MFVSAVVRAARSSKASGNSDFVVTEDGRRFEVRRVSSALEPIDIAVLVDNSAASMKAIPSIRDGLRDFRHADGSGEIKSPSLHWPIARHHLGGLHV